MIRGFVTGLVWGGIVAGAGLAVISQVAPLPQSVTPSVVAAPPPDLAEQGSTVKTPEAPVATDVPSVLPQSDPEGLPAAVQTPKLDAPSAETAPPGDSVSEPPLVVTKAPPDPMATPDSSMLAPETPQADTGDLPLQSPVPSVPPLSGDRAPAVAEPPPAVLLPSSEPLLEKAPDPVAPPDTSDGSAISALDPAPVLPETPRVIVPDGKPLTDRQDSEAENALPRIGDAPVLAEPLPVSATPLDLFSRPFDNPDAKPLFALVLIDDGTPDLDRETLAALPFPVTFVVDPLSPEVAKIAAVYRNAGQEVMIQTTGMPAGAKAEDIEQNYQAMDMAVPEAVAVLGAAGLDEDNRALADAVVPILVAQGRGILTMERGLNAVDQAARREGVPQATAFRILDAEGESVPVIRRYLDRAAFRAAQEGSVVVLGSTRPDTIAAILQWNVEGRAASVALAPISAVLRAED